AYLRDDQRLRLQPLAVPARGDVPDLRHGRDRARALRPHRGRERARRRLPDRIQLDELRALLARRIRQRAADVRHERRALLGRLAAADRLGAALCRSGHHLVLHQDLRLLLRLLLGEGHGPAFPLRPADAPRLEDLPAHLADLGVPGLGLPDAEDAGDAAMVSATLLLALAQAAEPVPV